MEEGVGLPGLRVHEDDILHRGGAFRQTGMGAGDEELASVEGDVLQVAGIAALRKDGGVIGGKVPFQKVGAVAPAGLPVVRLHDADDVRILLEPFLDPAQDQVILRGRHRDMAPLGKVPGDDGFRTRFRVNLHEGISPVQQEGLRPGHPGRGDGIVTGDLSAVRKAFQEGVPGGFGSVRDREVLQDIMRALGEFHAGNAFSIQEIIEGDGSLGKQGRSGQIGCAQKQKTKTSMHGLGDWLLATCFLLFQR